MKSTNPYESPLQECEPPSPKNVEPPEHGGWWVFASLIFAVLIEIFPTETDLLGVALLKKNMLNFFVAKFICLSVILGPLLVYLVIYGRRGLRKAKRRIGIIGAIVALKFAFDVFCLCHYLYS